MMAKGISNVIGFDDSPFSRDFRGKVPVVGAVFAESRFDGVLIGDVEKDGEDSAGCLAGLIERSRFREHIRLVMLQGIALGGFNVVDVFDLQERLGLPVLVVSRKKPDMDRIRGALLTHIPGGKKKWNVIERLGAMEPVGPVHIQRVGISRNEAEKTVGLFCVNSNIPEPLRIAHMIATAVVTGESRGNP